MQVNNEFTKLIASNLNFFYGSKQVLKNISLSFNKKEILDTLVEPKKVEAFDEFVQKALKEI